MKSDALNITAARLGDVEVIKRLGDGGQGTVYLVRASGEEYALKWYKASWSTPDQLKALEKLVSMGPPDPSGRVGKRFVWPLDIAKGPDGRFGYLMDVIDTSRFLEHTTVRANSSKQPSLLTLTEICFQLVDSFRALHLKGYCYRDISDGNVLMDTTNGDILICDNDNVGINGASKASVLGTLEFMAPEVVRGESDPSTNTDLHSLAALLFKLWTWHHPFHGKLEEEAEPLDDEAKLKLYGHPVFIFDPKDSSNKPPAEYQTVIRRWNDVCPPILKERFEQAFTSGLSQTHKRVTEGDWRSVFLSLQDSLHQCKSCGAELIMNLADTDGTACWNCGNVAPLPARLLVENGNSSHEMLLRPSFQLKRRHIAFDESGMDSKDDVIGELVQNPKDPKKWGLRNLSEVPWNVRVSGKGSSEIPPGKAIGISKSIELYIEGAKASVKS